MGGHSQGAGHAAYLAKQFAVDRVLMFAGPNDYSDYFSSAANWLEQPGFAAIAKHFAYLSLNDEIVSFSKQFANVFGLGMDDYSDSTYVDTSSPPYANSQLLYTTQSPGLLLLNHLVPIKFSLINIDVWTYMLTSTITTGLVNNRNDLEISCSPNPVTAVLRLKSTSNLMGKHYVLLNIQGQTIASKIITAVHESDIDLSCIPSGVYFLSIDNYTVRIVKGT